MTSPCAPQPKQWKKPFSSFTVKDGDFSLWNGQSPLYSRPFLTSRTLRPMTSGSETRRRISSRNPGGKAMRGGGVRGSGGGQGFLDERTRLLEVHLAGMAFLQGRHGPPHVLDAGGAEVGDDGTDRGARLGLVHLLRQEALDDCDLGRFLVDQVRPVALFVEFDALAPLLHHALEHGEHGRFVDAVLIAGAASLDILVLELGQDHPDGRGGALVTGLHGLFERVVKRLAQHGCIPSRRERGGIDRENSTPSPVESESHLRAPSARDPAMRGAHAGQPPAVKGDVTLDDGYPMALLEKLAGSCSPGDPEEVGFAARCGVLPVGFGFCHSPTGGRRASKG